jgi:hypothetical protein
VGRFWQWLFGAGEIKPCFEGKYQSVPIDRAALCSGCEQVVWDSPKCLICGSSALLRIDQIGQTEIDKAVERILSR